MSKISSPSFVLTCKLHTNKHMDSVMDKRFGYGCRIHNVLVKHVRKQLSKMRSDSEYKTLMEQYYALKGDKPAIKKQRTAIGKQLSEIRLSYGLSEYQLHDYVKIQQFRYRKHIHSHIAQKIATSVWKATEKVLFDNGKHIHFHKYDDFHTLESKNNVTGIIYKNGRIEWGGLIIYMDISKSDIYAGIALQSRVKYCRIKRIPLGRKYHYYVQLVLEGIPPAKHVIGAGRVGIDIGTSTVAAASQDNCILEPLGINTKDFDKKIIRISRKLDRSRRKTNPNEYHKDGTIKKKRHHWKNSKQYRKLRLYKHSLERKRAARLKQSHETLANVILEHGDTVFVEDMDFKALQRRAKETTVNKNGRYNRKGRFGKSLKNHAPAMLISIINRKLGYIGNHIHKVNTKTFRASQYNHVTDDYVKKKLSQRYTIVDGHKIQRDLYSAFLLMNSSDVLDKADRQRCINTFDSFLKAHDICINKLKLNNQKLPSCMGICNL